MVKCEKIDFEVIFEENTRRMHYHNLQLSTRLCDRRGVFPLGFPYRKIKPDLGVLSTYLNFSIHYYLINLYQKQMSKIDYSYFFRKK